MRWLLPLLLLLWPATPASSQPRDVELFGSVGAMRGGGDEGSLGSGVAYGGAATIPFADHWAVDLQALGARFGDNVNFRLRRVLISPGLQYRRGGDRALWFVAFGPGLQWDRRLRTDHTQSALTLHWRTGVVARPVSRLLVRGEFFG